ncbi:choice-of-anchor I family protein [Marinomonas sp. C2222]|uniref:Choice-of-anchor I family protein n=1 Tax=Marinomonas sargassi TaxID=2984494 RepID=A0ABT2YUA7_9GAMM|nr:choice-of-anchor I family protein [Marinomonas sargassi]MCV2403483.1 choice-of-anchor I family protein [Marinomonas sargassi]
MRLLPLLPLCIGAAVISGCSTQSHQESVTSSIKLSFLGRYESGIFDGSAAEIVDYSPSAEAAFVVNAKSGKIDVISISKPSNPTKVSSIDVGEDITTATGIPMGAANSVSIHKNIMAVAVEAKNKQSNGYIAFYNVANHSFITALEAGALPDMVTFSPNGEYALVANEGEPNDAYTIDPEGSISIISIPNNIADLTQSDVTQVNFQAFDKSGSRAHELPSDLRIFGLNASVAQDLEPEYISVSEDSRYAYVSLQENNGIAKVDISKKSISAIWSLGEKDYNQVGNELDISDKDKTLQLNNWPVIGLYQPDSIASYTVSGTTYIVTANEGDSRDYDGYSEEFRVKDISSELNSTIALTSPIKHKIEGSLEDSKNLGRMKFTSTLGAENCDLIKGKPNNCTYTKLYGFGARSFSIWNGEDGTQVFDSGSDFERITMEALGEQGFNASNDANKTDNRSDDKGPEPEALTLGKIDGRTYAFIGLERVGGIMVYDITNPTQGKFVQYITSRNFDADAETSAAGDLGPEGMAFVTADQSPTGQALLIVGNEVSGTTSVYQVTTH